MPIKLVRAAHCGAPRILAHRTSMGSCGEKNDWQFSNPRIDTSYCKWGLSMAKSIPGTLGRMSFARGDLLHADDCTLVLAAKVSDKLLLGCREALDIEEHDS